MAFLDKISSNTFRPLVLILIRPLGRTLPWRIDTQLLLANGSCSAEVSEARNCQKCMANKHNDLL